MGGKSSANTTFAVDYSQFVELTRILVNPRLTSATFLQHLLATLSLTMRIAGMIKTISVRNSGQIDGWDGGRVVGNSWPFAG